MLKWGILCSAIGFASSSSAHQSVNLVTNGRIITAFAHNIQSTQTSKSRKPGSVFFATENDQPSFLSTKKATVQFTSTQPANLSPIDSLLLTLTSDRFSLAIGLFGIAVLLLNRLFTFPEDVIYEGTRSRIDLLGVFAAGSVLLNGITKLDVTSVQAERVALEGIQTDSVNWIKSNVTIVLKETVEWVLISLVKCSPARTAVLLSNDGGEKKWEPIAMIGVLQIDKELQQSIPEGRTTPILDRMKKYDESSMNTKGGSVAGSSSLGRNRGPKESYLPTLQALPGRVEFTYLPSNAQEVLVLPVPTKSAEEGGRCYAVVLGGDVAKSFAPKDVAWCREVSAWIGDSLPDV